MEMRPRDQQKGGEPCDPAKTVEIRVILGGRAWPQEGGTPLPTSRHHLRALTEALDAPPPQFLRPGPLLWIST